MIPRRLIIILLVAITCVVALITPMYVMLSQDVFDYEYLKNNHPIFGIAWAFLGSIWAALGIISIIKQEYLTLLIRRDIQNVAFIENPKKFINRVEDIRSVILSIIEQNTISVYGQKGVGKSELLKYVCDVFRRKPCLKLLPKDLQQLVKRNLLKNSYYIDLSDEEGWEKIIEQISVNIVKEKFDNIMELSSKINDIKKSKPILIFLDNVNNYASVQDIIKNISIYKSQRPQDKIIFGSVSRLTDPRIEIWPIEIRPFKENHCKLFLNAKGIKVPSTKLDLLIAQSSGLPLYLNLISLYQGSLEKVEDSFSDYFLKNIYYRLEIEDQELLIFISICNISITTINRIDLNVAGISGLDGGLRRLTQYSAIIQTNLGISTEIKVHDLIRDILLDHIKSDIPQKTYDVAKFLKKCSPLASITILALSSNCTNNDINSIKKSIEQQINKNNYPFLLSYWENTNQWACKSSALYKNNQLQMMSVHGYIVALLGTGNYHKAEQIINSAMLYEIRAIRPDKIENHLSFDLLYSIADMDHLLNRYDIARESIIHLYDRATKMGWTDKQVQNLWLWAHLTGHIGDDLQGAISTYETCKLKAKELNNELWVIRASHGIDSMNFTKSGNENVSSEKIRALIDRAIAIQSGAPIISALYRNLSRYYRLNKDFIRADSAIEKSIEAAQETGLRTLINCDFSKGENARFSGDFKLAINYYTTVLDSTRNNGDINLHTSALLSSCICKLLIDKNTNEEILNDIENEIIFAEDESTKHNMLVTQVRAKIVRYLWSNFKKLNNSDLKSQIQSNAKHLGLSRDIQILESGIEKIKELEIHVH